MTRCALKGLPLPARVRLLKATGPWSAFFRDYESSWAFQYFARPDMPEGEIIRDIAELVADIRAHSEAYAEIIIRDPREGI